MLDVHSRKIAILNTLENKLSHVLKHIQFYSVYLYSTDLQGILRGLKKK